MSTIKVDTLVAADGSSAVTLTKQVAAKMNCSFVQSSATVQDSFNISSLTDLYVGGTRANYSNNFDHANHPVTATSNWDGVLSHDTYNTDNNEIRGRNGSNTALADRGHCHIIGSGDLA